MTNVVLKEPCIDFVNAYENEDCYNAIISDTYKILDLDLVRMKKEDVNFATSYTLKMNQNSQASAIVAWFDCIFEDLNKKVTLSTSPFKPYTHWKNTIFYLDQPILVKQGEKLQGSVAVRQSKENYRELDVKFSYHFNSPASGTQKDFI